MELLAQKDELYSHMAKEIEMVFQKIANFEKIIEETLLKGLVDKELTYDDENDDDDSGSD
jgi:hypothetical protein